MDPTVSSFMPLKFSSEVALRVPVCLESSEQEIQLPLHVRLLQTNRTRKTPKTLNLIPLWRTVSGNVLPSSMQIPDIELSVHFTQEKVEIEANLKQCLKLYTQVSAHVSFI